jgi:hypothetical protein
MDYQPNIQYYALIQVTFDLQLTNNGLRFGTNYRKMPVE